VLGALVAISLVELKDDVDRHRIEHVRVARAPLVFGDRHVAVVVYVRRRAVDALGALIGDVEHEDAAVLFVVRVKREPDETALTLVLELVAGLGPAFEHGSAHVERRGR
jgi:hypothetical protein